MTFVSYAQNFEDVLLWRALRSVGQGFFIDVGANDPEIHSVTNAFHLRGWRGINIEPVANFHHRLQVARSGDVNLRIAAGATATSVKLYEVVDTGLSTTDAALAERHRARGHEVLTSEVTVRALSSICAEHVSGEIHFLKIDVEGTEKEVLLGLDLERWRPWIVVIEAMAPMSQKPEHRAWEVLILARRYLFAYADGLNRFYVAEEHANLLAAFEYPPNVFDDYVLAPHQAAIEAAGGAEIAAANAETRAQEAAARAADLGEQIDQMSRQLAAETALTEAFSRRLHEREALLDRVYCSRSWRITVPLRKLGGSLRRWRYRARPSQVDGVLGKSGGPMGPTIFIECTHTYYSDLNTGIQRVVRNVMRHAHEAAARHGYAMVPVIVSDDGRLIEADIATVLRDKTASMEIAPSGTVAAQGAMPRFWPLIVQVGRAVWRFGLRTASSLLPFPRVKRFLYAPPYQAGFSRSLLLALHRVGWRSSRLNPRTPPDAERICLDWRTSCAGDILVLLDSSWTTPLWPPVRRFKERGGVIAGVIYDLIPVTHSYTSVPELTYAFATWLAEHVALTDVFIGISRSTAQQVADYLAQSVPQTFAMPITYFHLGSELDLISVGEEVRPDKREIFDAPRHIFLMVGSIEPRKNHPFVLDAFDRFWSLGGDATLVMVGRQGWKMDSLLDRIATHPECGRRLYLLRYATDTELDYGYRNASALVIASEIEGFGLPVVEAFQRGLPVLCSDIPVFREIADGRARFFSLADPDELVAALREFCLRHDPSGRRQRTPQPWLTWAESTEQLFSSMLQALNPSDHMHQFAEATQPGEPGMIRSMGGRTCKPATTASNARNKLLATTVGVR